MKFLKKYGIALAGLFIGLGLCVLGISLNHAVKTFKNSERIVSVKGLAEKEVLADRVIWPIVYKITGSELPQMYTNIETKNNQILAFLQNKGIDASEVHIASPEVQDRQAELYGGPQVSNMPRYNAISALIVSSSKVELIQSLMRQQADLLKQGIAITTSDYRYQTQYIYTQLNKIKPMMIEEATKNARLVANQFAIDAQSKLGKIKAANQGQFSITNRDENTPQIKSIRVVSTVDFYLKD
ncbi:MAG: SIMPL domain-containing protein [Bacteroidales bacterium]